MLLSLTLSITDWTPFTMTGILLVPIILAVKPLPKFLWEIVEMFNSFCFSSPNVTVIFALVSLIALTPFGLLIVTL